MAKRASKRKNADPTSGIRNAIIEGAFLPNERLIEEDLCTRFKANRGSVRLALARLEQEGLVTREPNRGARVRFVPPEEGVQIMQARVMLESLAARYAAERITPEELAELRQINEETRRLIEAGDLFGTSVANMRLHGAIIEFARHPISAKLLHGLRAQSVVYQFQMIMAPGRADLLLHVHEEIVDAIASGDPDTAERIMRAHLENVVEALRERVSLVTA